MIALATTAIGWLIFVVSILGWVIYYFANRNSARPELGSEIELAPNRRPYYDDETLEGSRLTRVSLLGVLMLGDHGHRPAAVLGARARPPGRRRQRQGSCSSLVGAKDCSRPPPTVASTAPAATAA